MFNKLKEAIALAEAKEFEEKAIDLMTEDSSFDDEIGEFLKQDIIKLTMSEGVEDFSDIEFVTEYDEEELMNEGISDIIFSKRYNAKRRDRQAREAEDRYLKSKKEWEDLESSTKDRTGHELSDKSKKLMKKDLDKAERRMLKSRERAIKARSKLKEDTDPMFLVDVILADSIISESDASKTAVLRRNAYEIEECNYLDDCGIKIFANENGDIFVARDDIEFILEASDYNLSEEEILDIILEDVASLSVDDICLFISAEQQMIQEAADVILMNEKEDSLPKMSLTKNIKNILKKYDKSAKQIKKDLPKATKEYDTKKAQDSMGQTERVMDKFTTDTIRNRDLESDARANISSAVAKVAPKKELTDFTKEEVKEYKDQVKQEKNAENLARKMEKAAQTEQKRSEKELANNRKDVDKALGNITKEVNNQEKTQKKIHDDAVKYATKNAEKSKHNSEKYHGVNKDYAKESIHDGIDYEKPQHEVAVSNKEVGRPGTSFEVATTNNNVGPAKDPKEFVKVNSSDSKPSSSDSKSEPASSNKSEKAPKEPKQPKEKVKLADTKFVQHLNKHKGKYIAGAIGAAALGAGGYYLYRKHKAKKEAEKRRREEEANKNEAMINLYIEDCELFIYKEDMDALLEACDYTHTVSEIAEFLIENADFNGGGIESTMALVESMDIDEDDFSNEDYDLIVESAYNLFEEDVVDIIDIYLEGKRLSREETREALKSAVEERDIALDKLWKDIRRGGEHKGDGGYYKQERKRIWDRFREKEAYLTNRTKSDNTWDPSKGDTLAQRHRNLENKFDTYDKNTEDIRISNKTDYDRTRKVNAAIEKQHNRENKRMSHVSNKYKKENVYDGAPKPKEMEYKKPEYEVATTKPAGAVEVYKSQPKQDNVSKPNTTTPKEEKSAKPQGPGAMAKLGDWASRHKKGLAIGALATAAAGAGGYYLYRKHKAKKAAEKAKEKQLEESLLRFDIDEYGDVLLYQEDINILYEAFDYELTEEEIVDILTEGVYLLAEADMKMTDKEIDEEIEEDEEIEDLLESVCEEF